MGLIIDIDMTRTEVVGVMPPAFVIGTALWQPLPIDWETTQLGNFFYWDVARLADGVTPAPGPVTHAAHRSISPRRRSNRSLRA